jgi:N-acetylglucosaminyl-diphospho-decaprenol L-rhamnosyltransferase
VIECEQEIMPSKVTVISVSYNSLTVLPSMLSSIPANTPIILIDNGSDDIKSINKLAQNHEAKLISNKVNVGFGTACNQGAELAKTEFLFFLNPDAILAPDTLDQLVIAAERYPDAVAMNPRIENGDGSQYFKRSSQLLGDSKKLPRGWPNTDCKIPVLSGAAFFVRRNDFDAVNGFDTNIFLYHEDDDLSYRLHTQRGPLMFIRETLVKHLGGQSTVRSPETGAIKGFHLGQSKVYVMRKHGIPFTRIKSISEAIFQLMSPVLLFSRRKRAKQWAYFLGVKSALKTFP